jgi:hypothetical protein
MKKLLLLLVTLFTISCSESDEVIATSIPSPSPLIGTWEYFWVEEPSQYFETYKFVDTYTFNADKTGLQKYEKISTHNGKIVYSHIMVFSNWRVVVGNKIELEHVNPPYSNNVYYINYNLVGDELTTTAIASNQKNIYKRKL